MQISCYLGKFDVVEYRHHTSQIREKAVTVDSLASSLKIALKDLPRGVQYVDVGTVGISVPLSQLNNFLYACDAPEEARSQLLLLLHSRASEPGFMSYAHLHIQDALTALDLYYSETGYDQEYPVGEVEETLYLIYAEFLKVGSYDPLLMRVDKSPMTAAEAWMLTMLETTTADVIFDFIRQGAEPSSILTYITATLKERLMHISRAILDMTSDFTAI
jgi:hypothetical protein